MWLHLENENVHSTLTQFLAPNSTTLQSYIPMTYKTREIQKLSHRKVCYGSTSRRPTCLTKIPHAGRRVTPVLSQLPLSLVIRQTREEEGWSQNGWPSFVFWLVDWWPDFPLSFGLCSISNNFRLKSQIIKIYRLIYL